MDTIKEKIVKDLWNGLGTAWSEFSEEEKEQFEKGWSVGYEVFDQLLSDVLQRTGNFSLLTAPPFFITSGLVFTFISTTAASLQLLKLNAAPEVQYIPRYIVYTEKLMPLNGEPDIVFQGIQYSNTYDSNREDENVENSIYILRDGKLELLDGTNPVWQQDALISGLETNSDNFNPYVE